MSHVPFADPPGPLVAYSSASRKGYTRRQVVVAVERLGIVPAPAGHLLVVTFATSTRKPLTTIPVQFFDVSMWA